MRVTGICFSGRQTRSPSARGRRGQLKTAEAGDIVESLAYSPDGSRRYASIASKENRNSTGFASRRVPSASIKPSRIAQRQRSTRSVSADSSRNSAIVAFHCLFRNGRGLPPLRTLGGLPQSSATHPTDDQSASASDCWLNSGSDHLAATELDLRDSQRGQPGPRKPEANCSLIFFIRSSRERIPVTRLFTIRSS